MVVRSVGGRRRETECRRWQVQARWARSAIDGEYMKMVRRSSVGKVVSVGGIIGGGY